MGEAMPAAVVRTWRDLQQPKAWKTARRGRQKVQGRPGSSAAQSAAQHTSAPASSVHGDILVVSGSSGRPLEGSKGIPSSTANSSSRRAYRRLSWVRMQPQRSEGEDGKGDAPHRTAATGSGQDMPVV